MNEQDQNAHPQPTRDQLAWLAFCYAAGELPARAAADFEQQLATDQSAREALAAALELTQVVMAVESHSGRREVMVAAGPPAWNARVSWMAVGGLAAALLLLLWSGVVGPAWQAAHRAMRLAAQQELAFAWNETRTELKQISEVGFSPAGFAADADAEFELPHLRLTDDEVVGEKAPSWLTVAVLLAQDQAAQNSSGTAAERLEN